MAARRCKVCESAQRPEVDGAILAGKNFRALEREFGISRSTLWKHSRHFGPALERVAAKVGAAYGKRLQGYLAKLEEEMLCVVKAARLEGKHDAAVNAAKAGRELAETSRKLLPKMMQAKEKRKQATEMREVEITYEEARPHVAQTQ